MDTLSLTYAELYDKAEFSLHYKSWDKKDTWTVFYSLSKANFEKKLEDVNVDYVQIRVIDPTLYERLKTELAPNHPARRNGEILFLLSVK